MARPPRGRRREAIAAHGESDDDEGMEEEEEEEEEEREGNGDMEMDYDPRAYDCLHSFALEWPCLSFDVVTDELGDERCGFPHTLVLVAGTQASAAEENAIVVARLSNLGQGRHGDKYDSEDEAFGDDSDDDDDDGVSGGKLLRTRFIKHHGGVNRTRCMPQNSGIVATWGDSGFVQVWDATQQMSELAAEDLGGKVDAAAAARASQKTVRLAPRHVFNGHEDEGFALGWSSLRAGRMASGDAKGRIHCWEAQEGGRWSVDRMARTGHASSVEDIAWSPTEETVFASSSVDMTVRIWDTRKNSAALTIKAHEADVNVISWNRLTSYMLASGADDGVFRIWDLRRFGDGAKPVAHFKYHTTPVTSIEWCPHEASSLSVSTDGAITIWDLAVERDAEEEMAIGVGVQDAPGHEELPPQLMFQHMGQTDVKEAHWHNQIPGILVSTAADGFNIFKPINIGSGPGTTM